MTATDLARPPSRGNPTKTGRTGSGHSGSAPRLPRGRRTVAAVIVAVVLLLLAGVRRLAGHPGPGRPATLLRSMPRPSPLG